MAYFSGIENRNINIVWKLLDDAKHLRLTLDYTLLEIGFAAVYCAFFLPALFVLPFLAAIGPDILAIGRVPWATTATCHVILPVTLLGIASIFGAKQFLAWSASGLLVALDRRIGRARVVEL